MSAARTPSLDFDRDVERLATPLTIPAESLATHHAADVRRLLALTNPIERHRSGNARIFSESDDYAGDYSEYVLAPFAHPSESRFSDGSYGVLYAGLTLETAFDESLYWLNRFFADATVINGALAKKQHLTFHACAAMADVRAQSGGIARLYDPNDYTVSQQWSAALRDLRHAGICYDSVRNPGGECVGLFIPRPAANVRVRDLIEFAWDGTHFATWKHVHNL